MPSPFPGMDPWLENPEDFPDVHDSLITFLREALNAILPDGYVARSARRVWIDDDQLRIPDVSVHGPSERGDQTAPVNWEASLAEAGMVAVEAPPREEPEFERLVEIREAGRNRLVTAIEILSPSNKDAASPGRPSYLRKQAEYHASAVNSVEIDLLRGGLHSTAVPESVLRHVAPDAVYHVCVSVPGGPRPHYIAAARLEQPLPKVVIPLRADQTPVTLSLQELLNRAYDSGRFAQSINYAEPPVPPLTPAQAEWAGQLLRAAGKI